MPEDTKDVPVDAAKHNASVTEAIKRYCRYPSAQGFALMLTGPWGSGKTHLVKSILDDIKSDNNREPFQKPIYVTLYGVRSVSEIGDQIFEQLHPFLGNRHTKLAGSFLRSALKAAIRVDIPFGGQGDVAGMAGLPDVTLSELFDGAKSRIVIFDDFERATMPRAEILGFINPLVEHDNCKVLILANEDEIEAGSEYSRKREKTIGRTLRMMADARSAWPSIVSEVEDEGARNYLNSIQIPVLNVFDASGLHNLRLLRQFAWVFESVWVTLQADQRSKATAVEAIALVLCASTLELASGTVPETAFRKSDINHFMRMRATDADNDTKAAQTMFDKYPNVNFDGTVLPPEVVRQTVMEGTVPADEIQSHLQNHPSFRRSTDIPSWRALWHSASLTADELEKVLERFRHDFDHRSFRHPAEVMHVVGLCLWLSEIEQPGWVKASVVEQLKKYVDDVFAADEENVAGGLSGLVKVTGGAFGLEFYSLKDVRFAVISAHLDKAAAAAGERAYPAIGHKLLSALGSDSEALAREVCPTIAGPSRYARLPVLRSIRPGAFATAWLNWDRRGQEKICMALWIRYEQAAAVPALQSELDWLNEVMDEIEAKTKDMAPIPRYHTEMLMRGMLEKHLRSRSSSKENPAV